MRPTWEHAVVVLAVACLGTACWLWDDGRRMALVPEPGVQPSSLGVTRVTPPQHEPFEAFWTEDGNPFVPYADRQRPGAASGGRNWKPAHGPIEPGPVAPPPSRDLPVRPPSQATIPVPIGFCAGADHRAIRVRDPVDGRTHEVQPGSRIQGFMFTAIEDGNVAVFSDETGRTYRLVIGTR